MSVKGLWIPSKMAPMIPGPSSTERGLPVRSTGSPTETPAKKFVEEITLENSVKYNLCWCKFLSDDEPKIHY